MGIRRHEIGGVGQQQLEPAVVEMGLEIGPQRPVIGIGPGRIRVDAGDWCRVAYWCGCASRRKQRPVLHPRVQHGSAPIQRRAHRSNRLPGFGERGFNGLAGRQRRIEDLTEHDRICVLDGELHPDHRRDAGFDHRGHHARPGICAVALCAFAGGQHGQPNAPPRDAVAQHGRRPAIFVAHGISQQQRAGAFQLAPARARLFLKDPMPGKMENMGAAHEFGQHPELGRVFDEHRRDRRNAVQRGPDAAQLGRRVQLSLGLRVGRRDHHPQWTGPDGVQRGRRHARDVFAPQHADPRVQGEEVVDPFLGGRRVWVGDEDEFPGHIGQRQRIDPDPNPQALVIAAIQAQAAEREQVSGVGREQRAGERLAHRDHVFGFERAVRQPPEGVAQRHGQFGRLRAQRVVDQRALRTDVEPFDHGVARVVVDKIEVKIDVVHLAKACSTIRRMPATRCKPTGASTASAPAKTM